MEHCLKNVLICAASDYSGVGESQKENFTFFPADIWKTGLHHLASTPVQLSATSLGKSLKNYNFFKLSLNS